MDSSGREDLAWLGSWKLDAVMLLIGGWFAWEALSSSYPWFVLAWPGVVLASPVWHFIIRLMRWPNRGWMVTSFPLFVFSAVSTLVLFALSTGEDNYLVAAYISSAWTALLLVALLLWLKWGRNREQNR